MKSKTQYYTDTLSIRKYLQRVAQISFSYSQINKAFSPFHSLPRSEIKEVHAFYLGLISDLKHIVNDFESEYEKPKLLETADPDRPKQ